MVASGDHNHKFKTEAKNKVIKAFANAPVSNPDGSTGITLHVDTGDLGGGNSLPHDNDLNPVWSEFDTIKAANFAPERHPIFHYAIMAHQYSGGCSSGLSRGIGASDFIVSLGCWPTKVGTVIEQAGTFMHELGHNLGLRHGGLDDVTYKPNFLSVMNYFFQLSGLYKNGTWGTLDYSTFMIKDLNENDLDEKEGLNIVGSDRPLRRYGTRAYCPGGISQDIAKSESKVDWDCDLINTEPSVAVDLNDDGLINTLTGNIIEWGRIVYDGGLIGVGLEEVLPMDFMMDELTYEESIK